MQWHQHAQSAELGHMPLLLVEFVPVERPRRRLLRPLFHALQECRNKADRERRLWRRAKMAALRPANSKRCSRCAAHKDISAFDDDGATGLLSRCCKVCATEL